VASVQASEQTAAAAASWRSASRSATAVVEQTGRSRLFAAEQHNGGQSDGQHGPEGVNPIHEHFSQNK
jgi:hypothetical protein